MSESSIFNWQVPPDHAAFAGHFPGRPIVPGVILLDQAILFAEQLLGTPNAAWVIGNAKFLSPVGPDELLSFTLKTNASGSIAFSVHSVDRIVASGSLTPTAV